MSQPWGGCGSPQPVLAVGQCVPGPRGNRCCPGRLLATAGATAERCRAPAPVTPTPAHHTRGREREAPPHTRVCARHAGSQHRGGDTAGRRGGGYTGTTAPTRAHAGHASRRRARAPARPTRAPATSHPRVPHAPGLTGPFRVSTSRTGSHRVPPGRSSRTHPPAPRDPAPAPAARATSVGGARLWPRPSPCSHEWTGRAPPLIRQLARLGGRALAGSVPPPRPAPPPIRAARRAPRGRRPLFVEGAGANGLAGGVRVDQWARGGRGGAGGHGTARPRARGGATAGPGDTGQHRNRPGPAAPFASTHLSRGGRAPRAGGGTVTPRPRHRAGACPPAGCSVQGHQGHPQQRLSPRCGAVSPGRWP